MSFGETVETHGDLNAPVRRARKMTSLAASADGLERAHMPDGCEMVDALRISMNLARIGDLAPRNIAIPTVPHPDLLMKRIDHMARFALATEGFPWRSR
jgi:hypothetical protein